MSEKSINQIYWEPGAKIFAEGSKVDFSGKNEVHFQNSMITSGVPIITWSSAKNFQTYRTVPQLPTLFVGNKYRLVNDYQAEPAEGVFTRITFYDLQGQEIDREEFYDQDKVFTYPQGAYRYEVSIVNAGSTKLDFRRLQIGDADLPLEAYEDWWTEDPHHQQRWDTMTVILMRDGKHYRSTTTEFDKLTNRPFQVVHTSWQYSGDFTHDLEQWIWNHDMKDARLVSTAKIFDVALETVHSDLLQTNLLLTKDYDVQLPKWASPSVTSPDWQQVAEAIYNRWGRG